MRDEQRPRTCSSRAKADPLAIGAVQRAAEARAAADAYEAAIRDIVDGMFGAE